MIDRVFRAAFSIGIVACLFAAQQAGGQELGALSPGLATDRTLLIDGDLREFHLFVPDRPIDAPLVVLLHGHNSSSDELLGLTGGAAPFSVWLDLAEQHDFLVAIPNGLFTSSEEKGWNDCRADAPTNSQADDTRFISEMIDEVTQAFRSDPRRVYATGISNGGHMAIRLAQEIPQKLAAIAPITAANAINSECPDATTPVSALFINGTADPLLPYTGGQIATDRGEVQSAEATLAYWVERNGADVEFETGQFPDLDTTDASRVETRIHRGGEGGTESALYTVVGGGHTAPSRTERLSAAAQNILGKQNGDFEMADAVWAFFEDKHASRFFGNFGALLYDAQASGDGFYLVHDGRFLSVAYFGYDTGGRLLWLVGTEHVSLLAPQFGEPMVLSLLEGGPRGQFQLPQDPNVDSLAKWGQVRLVLECSEDEPQRIIGTATLDGADGLKVMQLDSLLSDPGACAARSFD